ncbi:hypothetical protein MPC1_250003 [Methylocella tundrae]|nr:hypothetical protein MPC1_250003 [Methylocella tundrae]
MRRRLRLRDLPRLCRRGVGFADWQGLGPGRGHAGLCLWGAAEFEALLPDQGDAGTRRPEGYDAGPARLRPWSGNGGGFPYLGAHAAFAPRLEAKYSDPVMAAARRLLSRDHWSRAIRSRI